MVHMDSPPTLDLPLESRGARRREKGIEGGGDQSHRSLSPSANRPAQLAGPTHPPQTRRPHPHCPQTRRDVPRAVAAPSPALLVSKSTAVDSVTTWVLRLRRDGHIGSSLGLCDGLRRRGRGRDGRSERRRTRRWPCSAWPPACVDNLVSERTLRCVTVRQSVCRITG